MLQLDSKFCLHIANMLVFETSNDAVGVGSNVRNLSWCADWHDFIDFTRAASAEKYFDE